MRIKAEEREKLKRVLDLTLDIQELEATVFVWYSGHVDTVEIYVYKKGWYKDAEEDYANSYYLSSGKGTSYGESVDDCIASLERIKKELSKNI